MNTYSVIAVDDEGPALRRVSKLVKQHPKLELKGAAKTSDEARKLIMQYHPDILLLDIQLKEVTSFDMLKTFPEEYTGIIVFITAYDKYAIRAFEFGAVDYLLKPFTEERFTQTIGRIMQRNTKKSLSDILSLLSSFKDFNIDGFTSLPKENIIYLKSGSQTHKVRKDAILYIEKEGNYMSFHTKEKQILCRYNMKDLYDLVSEDKFIRVHKSFAVNKLYIDVIDTHVLYVGKKKIPIGRMYKENLLQHIDKQSL